MGGVCGRHTNAAMDLLFNSGNPLIGSGPTALPFISETTEVKRVDFSTFDQLALMAIP